MGRGSGIRLTIAVAVCLAVAVCFAVPAPVAAQQVGASVVVRGTVRQNLYVAGADADVRAEVEGDLVAAAGHVSLDGGVTRDVLAAGGVVIVTARVGEDVRVAGGTVTLGGRIGGELLAAGGRVRLAPETMVGGRAWLAAGHVEVRGRVGKGLRAAAGTIRLDGEVDGDVDLTGREIEIGPSARIAGALTYRSLQPARIDAGARIAAGVTRLEPERATRMAALGRTAFIVLSVMSLLALMVTGVVLLLLFPGFFTASARAVVASPWKSVGVGAATLVLTPLVALVLLLTVLGIPLALTLLAAYAVALLVGYLVTAVFVGQAGARLFGRGRPLSRGGQVAGLLIALIALAAARWIPIAGGLILLLALLVGLGALVLEIYRTYARRPAPPVGVP